MPVVFRGVQILVVLPLISCSFTSGCVPNTQGARDGEAAPCHELTQLILSSRDAQGSVEWTWPRTIFLTFQFYRFPPVTTPRLQLVSMEGGPGSGLAVPAQLLVRVNKDGTPSTGKLWFEHPHVAAPLHQSDLGFPLG